MTPAALLLTAALLAASPPVEVVPGSGGRAELVLAPRPGRDVAMVVSFRVGFVEDEGRRGLGRYLLRAMLSANQRGSYDALVSEIWASGGTLELGTGVRNTTVKLVVPREAFPAVARRLLPMILSPALIPTRLEEAQARVVDESPFESSALELTARMAAIAVDESGYDGHAMPSREDLEELEADELRAHAASVFTPANARIAVAGAFDPKLVKALAGSFARGRRSERPAPLLRLPVHKGIQGPTEMQLLAQAFTPSGPREAAELHLFTELVQTRVGDRLRHDGLAYAFSAEPMREEWLSGLLLVAPIRQRHQKAAEAILLAELDRLAAAPPDEQELARAKEGVAARLRQLDEAPGALAEVLAREPGWYAPAVIDALPTITAAELGARGAAWFAPASRLYLLFTPDDLLRRGGRP